MSKAKPTSKKTNKQADTKVTRITASDKKPAAKAETAAASVTKIKAKAKADTTKATKPSKKAVAADTKPRRRNPLAPLGRYFKGAWRELMQVRWPDRAATWRMTGALLAFCVFFLAFIVYFFVKGLGSVW